MVRKRLLLRGVFLLLLLAVVGWVIFTTTRGGLASKEVQAGQGRTLLEQFVISGGPIVWFILVPMSLVMVYLAAEYCLTIRRKTLLPADAGAEITRLAQEAELKRLAVEIGQRDDILGTAVSKALSKGVDDWFRMRETMFESVQDQAVSLMRRIEWINLIGNVSPMVGLFGTVVGMIQLFNAMVAAGGQPQPVQLAAGISVALVTTFWGLLIAIPALAAYGIFRNRIETLANEAITQGEEILAQVRRVLRKRMEGARDSTGPAKLTIREIRGKSSGQIKQQKQLLDER
ncbi:MAG: MotA/TolQ/ExbB proton channel family protein [Planctomycetota bacterium]